MEAGTPYYCLIRLIQKVHYTTVLAPLRGFSLQPKGFFRRTRGRIYVAFGEHPAAGVCVCVCSSKQVVLLLGCLCVYVFVRLFVCLFGCVLIRVSLCFLGWLVVCVYMCLCVFWHFSAYSCALLTLLGTALCFSCTLGGPEAPLQHLGLHFATLG